MEFLKDKVELGIRKEKKVSREAPIEKPRSRRKKNCKCRPHRALRVYRCKWRESRQGLRAWRWAAWNPPLLSVTSAVITPLLPLLRPRTRDRNAASSIRPSPRLYLPMGFLCYGSWITLSISLWPAMDDKDVVQQAGFPVNRPPRIKVLWPTVQQPWNFFWKLVPLWHLALSPNSLRPWSPSWISLVPLGPSSRIQHQRLPVGITGIARHGLNGKGCLHLWACL